MSNDRIERVARAWASIDGKTDRFESCKLDPTIEEVDGTYGGYMTEAAELLRRAGIAADGSDQPDVIWARIHPEVKDRVIGVPRPPMPGNHTLTEYIRRDLAISLGAILDRMLSDPPRETRWRPISSAPLDGTMVDLCVGGSTRYPQCYYRADLKEWWVVASIREGAEPLRLFTDETPTHWCSISMPKIHNGDVEMTGHHGDDQMNAPDCWWIDHGSHGQITQRPEEAHLAREHGKPVVQYLARLLPPVSNITESLQDFSQRMAEKHGDANGTQYEQGAWDMAMRFKSRALKISEACPNHDRYLVLCDWFVRGANRSEVHPAGHVQPTEQAHIDDWADRVIRAKKECAGNG